MGRFLEAFKHAFSTAPEEASQSLPAALEQLASSVVERGLETPAILLLETSRPLSFLAGQSLHAFKPFVAPFFNEAEVAAVATALEDKRNVRRLVERIERLTATRND